MTTIKLRNTRDLSSLKYVCDLADKVISEDARSGSTLRRRRRVVETYFEGSPLHLDISIPVTGLSRDVASNVLSVYQQRIANAQQVLAAVDPTQLVLLTDPRMATDRTEVAGDPTPTFVVFRIQLAQDAFANKANSQLVLHQLSQLSTLFDLEHLYSATHNAMYPNIPLYRYRGWPVSYCDAGSVWMVSGVDHLNGSSGVLEWCCSEDDANALVAEMRKDHRRFTLVVSLHGDDSYVRT